MECAPADANCNPLAALLLYLHPTSTCSARVPPTTARAVYGQHGDFSANTANNGGVSAAALNGPIGIREDSGGNLYIADRTNNRVLYYPQDSTIATRVYGQSGDFTTNAAGTTADTLTTPYEAIPDGEDLIVSDFGNNRLLRFAGTATTAVTVYGQNGNFTTNTAATSAQAFDKPNGLALDSDRRLFVSDVDNDRVISFASGSTTATGVYGQTDFVTQTAGTSNSKMDGPFGIALDAFGGLYVADQINNRVLFFPAGATTATRVYGQLGDFTTNTANKGGISPDSLSGPTGVAVDPFNGLYVADLNNARVLYFEPGSTTASRVYGQPDFTSATPDNGGVNANSLNGPVAVFRSCDGALYVSDFNGNRVLAY